MSSVEEATASSRRVTDNLDYGAVKTVAAALFFTTASTIAGRTYGPLRTSTSSPSFAPSKAFNGSFLMDDALVWIASYRANRDQNHIAVAS